MSGCLFCLIANSVCQPMYFQTVPRCGSWDGAC